MIIKITSDLYDIASRLKEIDPEYETVFNTDNQKFEVMKGGVTQVTLPYDNLDERTLRRVCYTRAENLPQILADLEKENAETERRHLKKAQDRLENDFSAAMRK